MALDRLALLRLRDKLTLAEAAELLAEKSGRNVGAIAAAAALLGEAVKRGQLRPVEVHYWNEGDWTFDRAQAAINEQETTVKGTDFEAWRMNLGVTKGQCDQGHDASSGLPQDALATARSWQERARAIADEVDAVDARTTAFRSLRDMADRVAQELRREGVLSNERLPLSRGTVLREALQGGRWKRKRAK
jgi:hypothetical protein